MAGSAPLVTRIELAIPRCASMNLGCNGSWTLFPENLHLPTVLRGCVICSAGPRNTATTRHSIERVLPFRSGHTGWYFGRLMRSIAASLPRSEMQARGSCSPERLMPIFISAGRLGMATSMGLGMKHDGACNIPGPELPASNGAHSRWVRLMADLKSRSRNPP